MGVCGPNDEAIGFEMHTPIKCSPNIQNHHQVVSTAITTELYCPPGQQQQNIGIDGGDKACFACPVGTYQPLRSKGPCVPCPFGKPSVPLLYIIRCTNDQSELTNRLTLSPNNRRRLSPARRGVPGAHARLLAAAPSPQRCGQGRPILHQVPNLRVQPAHRVHGCVSDTFDQHIDVSLRARQFKMLTCPSPPLNSTRTGGAYSNCTDGHQQGSPLCAICEEGFYGSGSGLCKACGPKRAIQITVCFALALAMAAFFALLYFFVRVRALPRVQTGLFRSVRFQLTPFFFLACRHITQHSPARTSTRWRTRSRTKCWRARGAKPSTGS